MIKSFIVMSILGIAAVSCDNRGMRGYVYIKPGTFTMGSPSTEPGRMEDDEPQHIVTLSRGFWMKETEVTQAEWEVVMGNNPSNLKGSSWPVKRGDLEVF